eukprot:1956677-Lingulodinium_polyedra.AAC.1
MLLHVRPCNCITRGPWPLSKPKPKTRTPPFGGKQNAVLCNGARPTRSALSNKTTITTALCANLDVAVAMRQ